MQIILAVAYQPERLQLAMMLEGMRHGDEALVTIPNVRVEPAPGDFSKRGRMYFCGIGPLVVERPVAQGDGKELPHEAELVGVFHAPEPGFFNLTGVKLSSNGKLQVIETPCTRFVPVTETAEERA